MGIIDDIKKDADKTFTKVQSTQEKEIEQMLNGLFYLDKDIPKELKFLKSVMTRGAETTERKGLHASAVIVSDDKFCIRQQVLSLFYKQLQGEQVPVGLRRIFSEGDAIHEKWQRLFIRGGLCKPLDCDYSRFAEEFDLSYTLYISYAFLQVCFVLIALFYFPVFFPIFQCIVQFHLDYIHNGIL
jgi:hypothetical protein